MITFSNAVRVFAETDSLGGEAVTEKNCVDSSATEACTNEARVNTISTTDNHNVIEKCITSPEAIKAVAPAKTVIKVVKRKLVL